MFFIKRLDVLRQVVTDFKELSRRGRTLAGMPTIESVQTFSVEGLGRFHVKEVTLIKDRIYYLILCKCMEPDDFSILEKDFGAIIGSFEFLQ